MTYQQRVPVMAPCVVRIFIPGRGPVRALLSRIDKDAGRVSYVTIEKPIEVQHDDVSRLSNMEVEPLSVERFRRNLRYAAREYGAESLNEPTKRAIQWTGSV